MSLSPVISGQSSPHGLLSNAREFLSAGWHVVTEGGLALYALITALIVSLLNLFLPESVVNKIIAASGYVSALFERFKGKITEIRLSHTKEDLAKAAVTIDRLNWEKKCGINFLQKTTERRNELVKENAKLKLENEQLQFKLNQASAPTHVTVSYTPHTTGQLSDDLMRLQKFVLCLQMQSDSIEKDSDMRSTILIIVQTAQKMLNQFEGTNDLLKI